MKVVFVIALVVAVSVISVLLRAWLTSLTRRKRDRPWRKTDDGGGYNGGDAGYTHSHNHSGHGHHHGDSGHGGDGGGGDGGGDGGGGD